MGMSGLLSSSTMTIRPSSCRPSSSRARHVPDDLFPGPRGVAPRPGNTGVPNSDVPPVLSGDRHDSAAQAETDGTQKGAAGNVHGRGTLAFYRLSIIARTVVTASTIVKREPPLLLDRGPRLRAALLGVGWGSKVGCRCDADSRRVSVALSRRDAEPSPLA